MDPLTHSLVAAVAAKSVGAPPRRFWMMVLLGGISDLDVVFNAFGSWAHLFQHRGLTHSLVGVAVQTFVYAALFARWDAGPYGRRAFHYGIALALHVVVDGLTSYGVPLFSPFNLVPVSADLMVSLGLIPIAFMLAGLGWMRRSGRTGWRAAAPIWVAWGVYFVIASSTKIYASRLAPEGLRAWTAIPTVANPFEWTGVAKDGRGAYKTYTVDVLSGLAEAGPAIPAPGKEFPIQASLSSFVVRDHVERERWPVARVRPDGPSAWRVEWGNLLFSTRGLVRGKVSVRVSADGAVSDERRIHSFWNP